MTLSILLLVAGVWMPSATVAIEVDGPKEGIAFLLVPILLGPTLFLFGVARLMGWAT